MIRRKLLATVSVAMFALPGLAFGATEALNTALSSGYDALASSEYGEIDIKDGDLFRMKSRRADAGGWVEPEELADWDIPAEHMDGLTDARARLMMAYDKGGDLVTPEHVAGAQVAFDCWVQEAEENDQPEEIEACKAKFEEHYALIRYPAPPVDEDATKVHDPISFNVYFDFDSTELNDEAYANIRAAAQAVREEVPASIAVGGHTDTSGSDAYNEKLSKARAEVVAAALIAEGVPEDLIEIEFFGETQPRIQTGDSVRERGNRRAEVRLRFKGYKSIDGLFGGVPGPDQSAPAEDAMMDEPMVDDTAPMEGEAEAPSDADLPAFLSEEQPMAEDAPAEEPMAEEEPMMEEPAAEEPMMDEPMAEEPMMEEPAAEEPMMEEPAAEEPMMDEAPAEEAPAEEPAPDAGGGEDLPDFLQDDGGAGNSEEDPLGFL